MNLRSRAAFLLCDNHGANAANALLDHLVPYRVIRQSRRPVAFALVVLRWWLAGGWRHV